MRKTYMPSNKQIIDYISKNYCSIDDAIEVLTADDPQDASVAVEKSLSEDTEVAEKGYTDYLRIEKQNEIILKAQAREELRQCENEFALKLSRVKKEGVTREVAEMQVWMNNPSLYNHYQACRRILDTQ